MTRVRTCLVKMSPCVFYVSAISAILPEAEMAQASRACKAGIFVLMLLRVVETSHLLVLVRLPMLEDEIWLLLLLLLFVLLDEEELRVSLGSSATPKIFCLVFGLLHVLLPAGLSRSAWRWRWIQKNVSCLHLAQGLYSSSRLFQVKCDRLSLSFSIRSFSTKHNLIYTPSQRT